MEGELPKRIFGENLEPEVNQINNTCRLSILTFLKKEIESEYEEVLADPLFEHVMALCENNLGYSARLIHSVLCRQLETSKRHELWFVFGRRPLRFSMQEFHAITGLKYERVDDIDYGDYVDDDGFWSKLLLADTSISISKIKKTHINDCNDWTVVDRRRMVYLCVIAGVILAMDERTAIPHKYIQLVMNLDNLRAYHWGLDSYDHLLKEIKSARPRLTQPNNYPLHGFSFTFQIWIMEAIPEIGNMLGVLGHKFIEDQIVFPRCSNWWGGCVVTYPELRNFEEHFKENVEGVWHPFISLTGNGDMIVSDSYKRIGERRDERIDLIYELLSTGKVWKDHEWAATVQRLTHRRRAVVQILDEEDQSANDDDVFCTPKSCKSSVSSSRNGKSKVRDYGVQERKRKILNAQSEGKQAAMNEETKSENKAELLAMEERIKKTLETEVGSRFSVFHTEFNDFREWTNTSLRTYTTSGPFSTPPATSAPTRFHKPSTKAPSRTTRHGPTSAKPAPPPPQAAVPITVIPATAPPGSASGSAPGSVPASGQAFTPTSIPVSAKSDPSSSKATTVSTITTFASIKEGIGKRQSANGTRQSVRIQDKVNTHDPLDNLHDVGVSQSESINFDMNLEDVIGSTNATVKEEPVAKSKEDIFVKKWKKLDRPNIDEESYAEPDAMLVLYKDKDCEALIEFGLTKDDTSFLWGQTLVSKDLLNRFIISKEWLVTMDMDAVMYYFRERKNLGLWTGAAVERVDFSCCNLVTSLINEWNRFRKKKEKYELDNVLLDYVRGELPADGRTKQVWGVDVDRIYVPFNVRNIHWIAICIHFKDRQITVFDCGNGQRHTDMEAVQTMIPCLFKAVQPPGTSNDVRLTRYALKHEKMPANINMNGCPCGVYALKYIECHVLGKPRSLITDANIEMARYKFAIDLFQAAQHPAYIHQMSKFTPPPTRTDGTVTELD